MAKLKEITKFTGRGERRAVRKIISRAMAMSVTAVLPTPDRLELEMDLAAVHARIPLRLAELAAADDFNFAHDVFGIRRHLNRKTGLLDNCFVPRFAKPLDPEGRDHA